MSAQDLYKNYTYSQLKKMYNDAARQARAAYKEVSAAFPQAETVIIHKGDFKSYSQLAKTEKGSLSKLDLAKELRSVERWLSSKSSSVEGLTESRAATVEAFNNSGYTFVNPDNLDAVKRFMKEMTERGIKAIYGSDQVLEAYNRARKKRLTNDQLQANIDRWDRNAAEVEKGRRSKKLTIRKPKGSSSKAF